MDIEELLVKHANTKWTVDYSSDRRHTKLSIEFAISVLEELMFTLSDKDAFPWIIEEIENKIQELKQYLDENKL